MKWPHNFLTSALLFSATLFCNPAQAIDKGSDYQAHARLGLLSGSYSGPGVDQRGFSTPTTVDIEFEVFLGKSESFNLRAIMAMELDTNRVNYTYAGVGKVYYLHSRGRFVLKKEKKVQVTNTPKIRYYWGWNGGVAQVLVIPYGLVLATYSSVFDISANGGMIYQISPKMGLEFRLGLGMSYGFSTVTVTGTTVRALLGVTYFM